MTKEKRILIARYSKLLRKSVQNIGFGISFKLARYKADKASYNTVISFLNDRKLLNGNNVIRDTDLSIISVNGVASYCRT